MSKSKFLKGFGTVVIVLALVRCIFPSIASQRGDSSSKGQSNVNSSAGNASTPSIHRQAFAPTSFKSKLDSSEHNTPNTMLN